MSRVGSALTSDRARAIADALGKLSYAGGATEGYMGQRLQEGLRAERLAEQKRQDELNALEEMRKLEREKFEASSAATLGAANIRAQAAAREEKARLAMEYINGPTGLTSRQNKIDAGMSVEDADRAVIREAQVMAENLFNASSALGSMQGLNVTPAMLAADEALGIN